LNPPTTTQCVTFICSIIFLIIIKFVYIFWAWYCWNLFVFFRSGSYGAWNSCILYCDSRLVRLLCGASYFRDIVLIFKLILFIFDISEFSYWTDRVKFWRLKMKTSRATAWLLNTMNNWFSISIVAYCGYMCNWIMETNAFIEFFSS
jgi:hypothetical protein